MKESLNMIKNIGKVSVILFLAICLLCSCSSGNDKKIIDKEKNLIFSDLPKISPQNNLKQFILDIYGGEGEIFFLANYGNKSFEEMTAGGKLVPDFATDSEDLWKNCEKVLSLIEYDKETSVTVEEEKEHSGEDFFTMEMVVDNKDDVEGVEQFITVYDSGEIYVYSPRISKNTYSVKLKNPKQVENIKLAVKYAENHYEELKHQVYVDLKDNSFKYEGISPESEAVKFMVISGTEDEISIEDVYVEKLEGDKFKKIGITEYQPAQIEESGRFLMGQFLLSDCPQFKEEGEYKINVKVKRNEETEVFEILFNVNKDAYVMKAFPKPMSEEFQKIYNENLVVWEYASPFLNDFSPENYTIEIPNVYLFMGCYYLNNNDVYNVNQNQAPIIPAELLESEIMKKFLLTSSQIREMAGENFFSEDQVYFFPDSYDGIRTYGIITEKRDIPNGFELDCSWYAMDDSLCYSHTVTIVDGKYTKNKVTFNALSKDLDVSTEQ